jgi:hypothetical protein
LLDDHRDQWHVGYPFDNWTVVKPTIATKWLSTEVTMSVRREIDVEASPEEVFEALATEEGRERWLSEPERHPIAMLAASLQMVLA